MPRRNRCGQDKYEKSDLAAAARALSTNLPPAIMGDFSGGCPTSWFNQFSGTLVVRLVFVSDPQITLPAVLLWPRVWPCMCVHTLAWQWCSDGRSSTSCVSLRRC